MDSHHKQSPVIVMMVPFPAQSHMSQLLRLSCLISSHNIPVHYAGSTIHNRQVKLRAHDIDPLDLERIHFHDLPLPPFLTPSPNPHSSTKFPAHLHPLLEASSHLRQHFTALLHRLLSPTAKRIVVIHDALMASVVQDSVSIPNTETYVFNTVSAFSSFFDQWEALGKPFQIEPELVPNELPSLEGCVTFEFMNFIVNQGEFLKFRAGDLINTSRSMEGTYIDLLEKIPGNKKHWAVGPINQVTICSKHGNSNSRNKCLSWLDKQAPKSVIYLSFGTTTSMTDEQINEIAISLEQSNTKFIWVLRYADKADIFTEEYRRSAELLEGFEKRMEGLGMIVRDWAPQLEILGHPSTGGFMSHCGWNSCLESLSMGVPIAAWPMHSDQPKNAVLISEMLRVGVIVKKWTHTQETVESSHIKEAVRRLMASEEGDQMRKRADALRESFKQSLGKDGVSCMELESFIAHITR